MKMRTTILIPFALGLMVSACSTTSTSSQGQVAKSMQGTGSIEPNAFVIGKKIHALEQSLSQNNAQLLALQTRLDKKDSLIADLDKSATTAESLVTLRNEQRLRDSLESQYAELKIENDHLVNQVSSLSEENKQQIEHTEDTGGYVSSGRDFLSLNNSFQTLDSQYYALNQEYQALNKQQLSLQHQYDLLMKVNQENQQALTSLKKSNADLTQELSESTAKNKALWWKIDSQRNSIDVSQKSTNTDIDQKQLAAMGGDALRDDITKLSGVVAAQKVLILEYQSDIAELEASLNTDNDNGDKMALLSERLSKLVAMNASVENRLKRSQLALKVSEANQQHLASALALSKRQQVSLQQQLSSLKAKMVGNKSQRMLLESQVNDLIPFQAEVSALQSQIDSGLSNVRWKIPNEIALHNNFEILVTATVDRPVSGQTYVAELIVDSAIQMVSASEAEAVLKNGELQWRWRVNGLNERPKAQLNLFISQQMNYQGQRIMRQVYRDSDAVALTNDDLIDKYGYWGLAILVGLLGGFLVGRINRKDKNS
ncbi:MAG: hypothetical protein ACTIM4_08745 [Marinomonas sp.]